MQKKLAAALLLMLMLAFAPAVTVETASLRGFLFGSAPGTQYDNWISHLAEGIARPGLNSYAPWEVQSNSFGDFRIPSPSDTLYWNSMLDLFLAGDLDGAQTVLNEAGFPYQIVLFNDTDSGRAYHMIRELPDFSYIDTNGTTATYDDEFGAFTYGWGLFIHNPQGSKPAIISAPHPCDDFPSPMMSYQALQIWDARFLMINGAGREAKWTESGYYDNSKSLSDPTRTTNHPFHKAYVKFANAIRNTGIREFSPQIHSYDWNTHPGYANCQITAGNPRDCPNLPIRDLSLLKHDLINQGDYLMVPANSVGTHADVLQSSFYSVKYSIYDFTFTDGVNTYPVNPYVDLPAYSQNRQMLHTLAGTSDWDVYDPFFHIEMDELPNVYGTSNSAFKWFYGWNAESQLWDMDNLFSNFVNYYGRWIYDMEPVLVEMFQMDDSVPPSAPTNLSILYQTESSVVLGWDCSSAYDFDSYEVLYGPDPPGVDNYTVLDRNTVAILASQLCENVTIALVTPGAPCFFRLRARDKNGEFSALSNMVYINAPPPAPVFTLAPSLWDFGTVVAGTPASKVFTVSNSGNLPLYITSVALTGFGADQYVLLDNNRYPVCLEGAASLSVTVLFQPSAEGLFLAQLQFTDDQARDIHNAYLAAFCTDAPNHGGGSTDTPAGGYYFANSLSVSAPCAPQYAWIDETSSAVAPIPDSGDLDEGIWGPLPLGFSFEYYGTFYSEVYICSNGYIQFGEGSIQSANTEMPSEPPPDNLIALFWDDLQYYDCISSIYYGGDNSTFVVTYDQLGRSGTVYDPGQSVTAQVALFSNGDIKLQYQTVTGSTHTPTIGIENGSGTYGIQYHYNGTGALYTNDDEGEGIAVMFGTNEESLPVELSAFTATVNLQNLVQLIWTTQSETNLSGFHVLRNSSADIATALAVSPLIAATNSTQTQTYIFIDTELFDPGTYYYWLEIIDLDGGVSFHQPLAINYAGGGVTPHLPIPFQTELLAAYPNPFNPSTAISYTLGEAGSVEIGIFNLKGQRIRSFHASQAAAGTYQFLWDGTDSMGKPTPSGVYFYRMSCGAYSCSKKMVLAK